MRFFHKFESINFWFSGLVDGILLSQKKKTQYTKTIEYLEKYSYVLDNIKIQETSDKFQNKIWQLWLQGEGNMPPIVKKCHKTIKKFHKENVILLTKENLKDYVDLPNYIEEKYKKGIISHAHYSDMVRLFLLAKYGGLWADSTIFLTEKIPDEILKSDFFTFKSTESENLKFIQNLEQFKIYSNHLNAIITFGTSYFLGAKKGNLLINAMLSLLFEYWKNENKACDYLFFDKFFNIAVLKNEECKKKFLNMPKYYLENALMLQHALFEPFDEELFKNIKQISPIHKLTHKNLHRNSYKNSFLNYLLNFEVKDV